MRGYYLKFLSRDAFPDDIDVPPRSWAEKAYPNLIFYNRHDKGGHFAAWEQPESLTSDFARGVPVAALNDQFGRTR